MGDSVDALPCPSPEQVRRVYLEETVPRIHFGPGREKRRLVSDVIAPRDPTEIRSIVAWLRSSVAGFSGHLFAFSIHDGDHIHVLHDCAFSNGTCRCQWRQQSRVAASIRRRLGRKSVFVGNVGSSAWHALLTYYLFQAGIQGAALFLGGQESKVPDAPSAVRHDRLGHTDQLVEAQVSGDGCRIRGEQSPTQDRQPDRESLLEGPKAKRGRFGKMCQKTQVLLKKYYPVPCESIRTLLSPQSSEFDIDFFDPTKDKVVAASIEVFKQEILNLNLRDFFVLLEGKLPVFYANNADPFVYYLDRVQSYNILMKLLNFQFRGDEEEIKYVLGNVCRWFDRGGWLEKDGTLNVKCNTIVVEGPPNSGKNFFWDTPISLASNVGHIGRINNKTNNFALQDCANRRAIIGNELNMEQDAINDFKKLCEGSALNVRVKHSADKVVFKTPTLILTNDALEICTDPAFKNIRVKHFRWRKADFLKDIPKRPYPMAFFDVLDYYDIKF